MNKSLTAETDRARPMGLWSAAALVTASMIGAGVFTTSGYALEELGSPERVLAAWLVGGLVAIAGAVSYGALARGLVESGGEYVFLARRVHPLAGFLAGWVSLVAGFTVAMAFAAALLDEYAAPLLPVELPRGLIATAAIGICAVLHSMHVAGGAWLQNAVIAVKLLGIGALILAGWWWIGERSEAIPALAAGPVTWWTVGNQLTWIAVAYSGFNAAVYVAEEVRDAERNVPRAMLLATLLVAVLYLALNTVFVYAGPIDQLAGNPDVAARAMRLLGGPTAETACRVLVCVALASSVSALTMAGPRVYAKMAADGLFPIRPQQAGAAPQDAIVLQAGLAMAMVWFTSLRQQLDYLGFMLSLSAAGTVASLYWRRRAGASVRPTRVQLAAAAVFVVATLVFAALAAVRSPVPSAQAGGVTLATGVAAYFAMRWRNRA